MRPATLSPTRLAVPVLLGLAASACGQTGPLVLPQRSPPKQDYLLVSRPPPGTPKPAPQTPDQNPAKVKAIPVPSPTAPFPPQPVEPRSPLSTQTP